MILCPDCKNEISLKADTCPKCGFPLSEGELSAEQAPIIINRDKHTDYEVYLDQLHNTLDLRTSDTLVDSLQGKDGEIPLIHDKIMSYLESDGGFFYYVADAMGYSTKVFGIPKKPEWVHKEVVARLRGISEIEQVYWVAMGVSWIVGAHVSDTSGELVCDGRFAGKLTIGECLETLEAMMKRSEEEVLLRKSNNTEWDN